MRIRLLSYGSRGDVQPLAALALGLQAAGHTVRLAAPQRFVDFIQNLNLPYAPLPGDPEEISRRLNTAGTNPLRAMQALQGYIRSIMDELITAALAACADADCIVHSYLFTAGAHAYAFARGIPDVSVQLFPMFAPTRAFPNPVLSQLPPGWPSLLSHRLAVAGFRREFEQALRGWRNPDPKKYPLHRHWPFDPPEPRSPLIMAYSPSVLPRPADWTADYIHVPGYFFLPIEESYYPPADLLAFLRAGPPPVCISFGSMVSEHAAALQQTVLRALANCGQRAIWLTGWGAKPLPQAGVPVFHLPAAPHDWLLPRCAAVMHHGGAGTTGAGLRAGIPNIVIPHMGDQAFWARRVATLRAGPEPLPLNKITVDRLSAAIRACENAELRSRAKAIGAQLRAENGVAAAVEIIERHAAHVNRR